MMASRLLLACAIALLLGCSPTPPRKIHAAAPPPTAAPDQIDLSAYRLGIGDRVRVDVFGEPELSVEAVVDGTGQIAYPLIGPIPTRLKTAAELERAIRAGLAAGYLRDPNVRVAVVQYRPFYTIGQVKKPGAYPYVIGLTVEKALALAGGLTNVASTRQMYLLREDATQAKRIKVGLDAIVLPGDTLLVEEGLF